MKFGSVEGQLLQMLASLQKQLDEQRAEVAPECEKATLVRDVMARVQIEILRKSQFTKNQGAKGSLDPCHRLLLQEPSTLRAVGGMLDLTS